MGARVFDDRLCALGEGPLWHPKRQQLFWFDILGQRLLSQRDGQQIDWTFDEIVSAAGWVDETTLLIVGETGFRRFDIATGDHDPICPLEADTPETRSNDGRADPMGGFWIGTMGKAAEPGAGAIYRYYRGAVELLFPEISIPNAICFAPDGRTAYFTDTPTKTIRRQPLDAAGWPEGPAEAFIDLNVEGLNPDGAVVDAAGYLWNAQWGAGRIARYDPEGRFDRAVAVAGRHSSCPAFGGADLRTLFCTSARQGILDPDSAQGVVYACETDVTGQAEPRVIL